MRFSHGASCPEIAPVECGEEDIPDHFHHQTLTLLRMEPRFSAGLGKGFLINLAIPIDLKLTRFRYTLTDGSPFEPSQARLLHQEQDRIGLSDIRIEFKGYRGIAETPMIIGARLGVVLPTGATTSSPFGAREAGHTQRTLQFGGGTFDPTAGIELILYGAKVGMIGQFGGRFPLYENQHGYRGPIALNGSIGPNFRLPEPVRALQITTIMTASWLSPEYWDGEPAENSGLGTVGAAIALTWNINPKLALSGSLNFRIFEDAEGEQFKQPVAGTGGISGFFAVPKKEKTEETAR